LKTKGAVLVGGLLILATVGLGAYSAAYALEGPAGINDGIKLWLDADQQSQKYMFSDSGCSTLILPSSTLILPTGPDILCWKDRSGNAAHVKETFIHRSSSASTDHGEPQYQRDDGALNGKPYVLFNKSEKDALAHNPLTTNWAGPHSLFLVVQQTANMNQWESYFANGRHRDRGSQLQVGCLYGPCSDTGSGWIAYAQNAGGMGKFGTVEVDRERIYTLHNDDGGSSDKTTTYIDGVATPYSQPARPQTFAKYLIGLNRHVNSWTDFHLTELVLYDRALDNCELSDVHEYLATKYGISFIPDPDCPCSGGIAPPTGLPAAVSFSTGSLGDDTLLFQGTFDPVDWSGDLIAYTLGAKGALAPERWRTTTTLDSPDVTPESRNMMTWGRNGEGIAFQWDSLTEDEDGHFDQQNDLATETDGTIGTDGKKRLDYLRGDTSNEGSGLEFRVRGGRLGDIFGSQPVYVGAPNRNWPDNGGGFPEGANKYSNFASGNSDRTAVVYVGANDGALHGFSADTGQELLAYFPGNLWTGEHRAGYHYLTEDKFKFRHRRYVDGTPTVSDAYVRTTSSTDSTAGWHTILLGTEGGGGRGLFALDVTDPNDFVESNTADVVLWEFDHTVDDSLGYTYSQPTIALLNNGRWAAITGNGYGSDPGLAELLILYLDGGLDDTWTDGTDGTDDDYRRISTNSGSIADKNGLSTPALVDLDGNGTADRVYAGDLLGNLWAFDLSSASPAAWGVAHSDVPLFAGQSNQPITVKPIIIRHPTESQGTDPNLLVLFGTGRFLTKADRSTTDTQTFYGVWDNGDDGLDRNDLVAQTLATADGGRVTDPDLAANSAAPTGQQQGWYIDLPDSGERVVSEALVRAGIVFFNTFIPDSSVCAASDSGWEMSVKAENGGSPGAPVFDFNRSGSVDVDGDTTDASGENIAYAGRKLDLEQTGIPAGPSIIGNRRFTQRSATDEGTEIVETVLSEATATVTGRLSWEQLFPD
jgi:type IV pilus assembly protein PilY1